MYTHDPTTKPLISRCESYLQYTHVRRGASAGRNDEERNTKIRWLEGAFKTHSFHHGRRLVVRCERQNRIGYWVRHVCVCVFVCVYSSL